MNLVGTFVDFPSAYLSFSDIPEHLKLHNFVDRFDDVDLWHEYEQDQFYDQNGEHLKSDKQIERFENAETSWKEFCEKKESHHGLATPSIVDQWCQELLNEMKAVTVLHNYIKKVNKFYRYLMWNIDYPHIYNPIQLAVAEYSTPERIWDEYDGKNNWRDYID